MSVKVKGYGQIIRNKITSETGILVHNSILEIKDLKLLGLLLVMLSKPDDWLICVDELTKDGFSTNAVRYGLQKLEEMRYIQRYVIRDKMGRTYSSGSIVYDSPYDPIERIVFAQYDEEKNELNLLQAGETSKTIHYEEFDEAKRVDKFLEFHPDDELITEENVISSHVKTWVKKDEYENHNHCKAYHITTTFSDKYCISIQAKEAYLELVDRFKRYMNIQMMDFHRTTGEPLLAFSCFTFENDYYGFGISGLYRGFLTSSANISESRLVNIVTNGLRENNRIP